MKTIGLLLVFFLFYATVASPNTIIVKKGSALNSLDKALRLATEGDTIIVKPGNYTSFNTLINKSVTVLGENFPVLDARFKEEVITIRANKVTFSGFVLKNSKTGSLRDYAGIRVHQSEFVTISNNRLVNNFFGIYLSDSKHINVLNNRCQGSRDQQNSGNGIHAWQCSNILIRGNTSTGHRDGIYFEFVKKSIIERNRSENNIRYGLHFMFSDDDLYHRNTFRNNGSGVAVMYSKRIRMTGNLFIENWGSSICGLLLKDISKCHITHNQFTRNTTAVYMEGCESIHLSDNNFNNNGWGLRVLANCSNGLFEKNNFYANSFDVTTNGTLNLNVFKNNYWDKYDGYDLNKDGTGDVPYRPVSLYAQLIEQVPQSLMLMRGFMVNILDKVERAVPSLTPESVKDNTPRMKKWVR